jgi:hypothetical protein
LCFAFSFERSFAVLRRFRFDVFFFGVALTVKPLSGCAVGGLAAADLSPAAPKGHPPQVERT